VTIEDGEPAYAFYDQGAADTLLSTEEVPASLFDETSILHFGSISLLRGTTPTAILRTVQRLKAALLSFDPNLSRSRRDAASYRAPPGRAIFSADMSR
jgi:fructokinase